MSLTCLISNVSVQVDSFQRPDKIDEHTQLTIVVRDDTGTASYQKGNPIALSDSILGTLFTGYVAQAHVENLYPNVTNLWTLTCLQEGDYLASKRTSKRGMYNNQYSGTIAVDQIQGNGAEEGLLARAALRWDELLTDWQAGTLTNTVATTNATDGNPGDGDLELALAGSVVNFTVNATTNIFSSNGYNSGSSISCNKMKAIQYTASCTVPGAGNNYLYISIMRSVGRVINTNDQLQYDVWISKASKKIMAGVDIVCTDGSTLRDIGTIFDQQWMSPHPQTDLTGLADNQWYSRSFNIGFSALAGKTIDFIAIAFEGDDTGDYAAYFRRIKIVNGGSTVVDVFNDASTTTPNIPQVTYRSSYTNESITVVDAYDQTATIITNVQNLGGAGIYRSSTVSWAANVPSGCSIAITGTMDRTASGNAAVFELLTNNAPMPGLVPGMDLTSLSTFFDIFLYNNSNTPTISPQFNSLNLTINPSYIAAKSDVRHKTKLTADYTGVLTNVTANNNILYISGYQNKLDGISSPLPSVTLYGNSSPSYQQVNRSLRLQATNGTDAKLLINDAGNWQNFIASVDVQFSSANLSAGLFFRTSNYGSGNYNYGYVVYLQQNLLGFAHGSNSSSSSDGTFTSIATQTLTLSTNQWYTIQVQVSGTTFDVWVNGVHYFSAISDSTYNFSGGIGLHSYNNSGGSNPAYFKNFGVVAALSGTYVTPAIDIHSAGSVLAAFVRAQAHGDTQGTVKAEISLNNGSTWTDCAGVQSATQTVNDLNYLAETVPGLAPTTNVSSMTQVKLRWTLSISSPSVHLEMQGFIFYVLSAYSASGTRISTALSLAGVGRAGTALVNWNANIPTNTSLTVQTSINGGSTWQTVSTPGGAISGISVQPSPNEDTFASNSSANYTQSNWGGTTGSWIWDTANSRLVGSGGNFGTIVNSTPLTAADNQCFADFDQADGSGILTNYTATTSGYYILIYDASAGATPNTCKLFRRSGGVSAQVGSTASVTFARGTIKRFVLDVQAGAITVLMDGVSIITYTDGSPLGAGSSGLVLNALARVYSLYIQQYGQDVTGLSLLTKLIVASTDPTATPQVLDMQAMVSSPDIGPGVLVTNVNYKGKFIGDNLKDLTTRSNYWYYFGSNNSGPYGAGPYGAGPYGGNSRNLFFQPRNALSAPFVMAIVNSQTIAGQAIGDILLDGAGLDVLADSYRNRMIMQNAIATGTYTETKAGDGKTRTWNVARPLSVPPTSITLNGKIQTFGIKNVDTGKNFYYQLNSTAIDQDSGGTLLQPPDSFVIVYTGTSTQDVIRDNTAFAGTITQSMMAAIENAAGGSSSGIVEVVYDASGLNVAQAQALGDQLNQRYGVIGDTFTFKTLRSLVPGMQVPLFISQYNLQDVQFLVTQVDVVPNLSSAITGGILYMWKITVMTGPNLGSWVQLFKNLIGG